MTSLYLRNFWEKENRVLLIDDFLANGKALEGLAQLVQDSGAELVGAGIVIEKGFQRGGDVHSCQGDPSGISGYCRRYE